MYIWGWSGELNAKRIRERYLQAILRQEIAFFDKVGAGEVATRIQTDTRKFNQGFLSEFKLKYLTVDLVQQGTSEKVPLAVQFTSAFVTGFVRKPSPALRYISLTSNPVAFIRSWRLALALSSIFPCLLLTGALMATFSTKWVKLSLSHVASSATLAEEVISTIRTAHSLNSQKTLSGLYDSHINQAEEVDMRIALVNGIGIGVFFFTVYSAYALAFYFGTTLILDGRADVGVVVSVFMAILIGSISLVIVGPEVQAITQAIGAGAKLFEVIERVPGIDSLSDEGVKLSNEDVRGEIEFKDVGFSYPSRPDVPIFNSLSIKFTAGKTTALVGPSGSGKSTIVALLERFYDPSSGSITIDSHPLNTLNLTSLRSNIGLVSQEPVLFSTTIFDNVAFGLIGSRFEGVDEKEKERMVRDACVIANADGFVQKLPNGYRTLVGEKGLLLSGGQKRKFNHYDS